MPREERAPCGSNARTCSARRCFSWPRSADFWRSFARIEALLRKVDKHSRPALKRFALEDVSVDFEQAEVCRAGQRVPLAAKEFQLLEYLIHNRARVLPREEMLQKVWQCDSEVCSRTVDVHIARLRQKLDNPQSPRYIQTLRGRGYKFAT